MVYEYIPSEDEMKTFDQWSYWFRMNRKEIERWTTEQSVDRLNAMWPVPTELDVVLALIEVVMSK